MSKGQIIAAQIWLLSNHTARQAAKLTDVSASHGLCGRRPCCNSRLSGLMR
jgi:hypothetical protein